MLLTRNGRYVGETSCNEATGLCDVPHGRGTFVDHDGNTLYDGEWRKGKLIFPPS